MSTSVRSNVLRKAAKTVFAAADVFYGAFPGPRILIYHQVGVMLGREMEVALETFRSHLDIIGKFGKVVDLETAVARRGDPEADRLVVLTFDDGYEDVYRNAFPLLKERGWPFTLYLTTAPIVSGEALDPHYPDARPFTWDQVNEMAETGLATIGAHTHSHPDLRRLSADRLGEELETSNRLIEQATGAPPRHFTYPWGYWAPEADRLVRERYATATVGGGGPVRADTDPYLLPRIPVQRSDGLRFFKKKLRTGLRMEDRVRGRVRGYAGP